MKFGYALVVFAAAAFFSPAAFAEAEPPDPDMAKSYDEDVDVAYGNNIDVDISKAVDVSKDLNLVGTVTIMGTIDVEESAMSTTDNKQIVDDGVVDVLGSDAILTNDASLDADVLGGASGNIGVNVAVGDANLQENAAALSAIGTTAAAGSADAENFSVQKGINNEFDDGVEDATITNTTSLLGNLLAAATGNIGLNVTAGAFNIQKNALTIAAVTGSATLSEASAAVLQQSTFNSSSHNQTQNKVQVGGTVANAASGNIGMNLSSGAHNLQQNTLAISSVQ